jgi:predicted amidohydrolase YtcJ
MVNFIKQVAECGVTSVSDMGATDFTAGEPNPLEALQQLTEEGKLADIIAVDRNLFDIPESDTFNTYHIKRSPSRLLFCLVI